MKHGFSMMAGLLSTVLLGACSDGGGGDVVQLLPKRVELDDNQQFRLEVQNRSARVVSLDKVQVSCSCTKMDAHPKSVAAGSTAVLTGKVTLENAPESVGISVFLDGVRHSARVHIATQVPKWDRDIVYHVGIRPGAEFDELVGVYLEGSREAAQAQLPGLVLDLPHVASHEWGAVRPVEGRRARWYSALKVRLDKEIGREPISGSLKLRGAEIRVILVPLASE